jgi:FMN phosphatase YigB (HAD superfamily)
MTQCIIFDLSEVLIAGLVGVEKELSPALSIPEHEILPCFLDSLFEDLLLGNISEETYLKHLIAKEGWPLDISSLQGAIRRNFHHEVEGSISILMDLAADYELVLLSDHVMEWVAYIRSIHPFIQVFEQAFFSYDLRGTKRDPETFSRVLDLLSVSPTDCLFVDDNPANVRVAESVGLGGIRFVNAEQLATEFGVRLVKGLGR